MKSLHDNWNNDASIMRTDASSKRNCRHDLSLLCLTSRKMVEDSSYDPEDIKKDCRLGRKGIHDPLQLK